MSNYYVIGSGIVGSVISHELALAGHTVTLYEKRAHSGGNLYDVTEKHGIRVQMYGPHIFHTNNRSIYEYIADHCELQKYNLVCGAVIDGKCVPTAFDFTAIDTFFQEESEVIKEHIRQVFKDKKSATVLEMLESKDSYVKKFAQFLYDKDYKPYTAKQWGMDPDEVDPQIFHRVPIHFSYENGYFEDKFQYMPVNGYSELIENLLNHNNIELMLNTDGLELFHIANDRIYMKGKEVDGILIYTGPIDELFCWEFGELPYRSLNFQWRYEEIESIQAFPVVAYPQAKGYTRITEYKKLPIQHNSGTAYAVEYPLPYVPGMHQEPYYPVHTESSRNLAAQYRNKAAKVKNLICAGRLADFQYYNIDQAVKRALEVSKNILKRDIEK